jgi:serine/threonine protein kinase
VAHLDVKPENVLLLSAERPLHVLLTDFGSARGFLDPETSNYKEHVDIVGTPCYVAPDVVRKKYHPPQADMWSAGMTMLTLLSGELLFDSPLTDVILHRVSTTKIVLPPIVTKKTSTACQNLLQRLLRRRGCDRPSSQAACAHPWIVTRGKHTDDMDVPLPDEPEGEPTTGVAHIPSKKAPSPKPLRNREEHETGANTPEDSNQGKVTTTTTNTTTVTTASTSTANGATTTLPAPGAGAPSATTAAIKPVYAKDHAEYFLF